MSSIRSRKWCFTFNNYTQADCDRIASIGCEYVVFGKEIAPGTGTRHLQGYICWPNARSLSGARNALGGGHLSVARGSAGQNKLYCSKEGDVVEVGVLPADQESQGAIEIARWAAGLGAAKLGLFDEIPPDMFVRYYSAWRRIHQDYMPRVADLAGPCGVWVYGLSGSGKTTSTVAKFPGAFRKPRNQWWDGFMGEPVVLLDDVDRYDVALGGKLKHWADSFAFVAEVKGGSRRIRPTRLIVTSQYRIGQIWPDEETKTALERRFTFIEKKQGEDIDWPQEDLVEEVVLVE